MQLIDIYIFQYLIGFVFIFHSINIYICSALQCLSTVITNGCQRASSLYDPRLNSTAEQLYDFRVYKEPLLCICTVQQCDKTRQRIEVVFRVGSGS